jgi:hypothetical protein
MRRILFSAAVIVGVVGGSSMPATANPLGTSRLISPNVETMSVEEVGWRRQYRRYGYPVPYAYYPPAYGYYAPPPAYAYYPPTYGYYPAPPGSPVVSKALQAICAGSKSPEIAKRSYATIIIVVVAKIGVEDALLSARRPLQELGEAVHLVVVARLWKGEIFSKEL